MNTIVVYDTTGYVLYTSTGPVREPIGIPFLWVEIPDNMRIKLTNGIGVDVNVTPNVAILEDIPLTDIEILNKKTSTQDSVLTEIIEDILPEIFGMLG